MLGEGHVRPRNKTTRQKKKRKGKKKNPSHLFPSSLILEEQGNFRGRHGEGGDQGVPQLRLAPRCLVLGPPISVVPDVSFIGSGCQGIALYLLCLPQSAIVRFSLESGERELEPRHRCWCRRWRWVARWGHRKKGGQGRQL